MSFPNGKGGGLVNGVLMLLDLVFTAVVFSAGGVITSRQISGHPKERWLAAGILDIIAGGEDPPCDADLILF